MGQITLDSLISGGLTTPDIPPAPEGFVSNDAELKGLLRWLEDYDEVAVDTETTGLRPYKGDRVCGVSLTAAGRDWYVSVRHERGPNVSSEGYQRLIEALSTKKLVTWNGKFDLHMLCRDGLAVPERGRFEDAMIAAHLLDENADSLALKTLADTKIPGASVEEQELKDMIYQMFALRKNLKQGAWKEYMWRIDGQAVAPYAMADTRLTMAMRDLQLPYLDLHGLLNLWREMNDYTLVMFRAEQRGMLIDRERIQQHSKDNVKAMEQTAYEIRDMAGDPNLNPNSPVQLKRAFGWQSTSSDVLKWLTDSEPAKAVLTYRTQAKLDSNYYNKYLELADDNNVLHGDFKMTGTVSGRLSCGDPNLMQVPKHSPKTPVKDVIVARPGYVIAEVDFVACELRVGAHFAHEEGMASIIRSGGDPHQVTADALGTTRQVGKTCNFSLVYGGGPQILVTRLNIPMEKASEYVEAFNRRYPAFRKLYIGAQRQAEKVGYIRLPSGRMRHFRTPNPAKAPPHTASNFLIQGTAAEVLRISLMRIDEELRPQDVHILAQVHDSVILEVPENRLDLLNQVKEIMTDFSFDLPMDVEIKVGRDWGNVNEWDGNNAYISK